MSDSRWPAIAIQSLFLILNMTFLLAGGKEINWFIIASTTVIFFLVLIQLFSQNVRFWYLFPVRNVIPNSPMLRRSYPTTSWDTWILRSLIALSIGLFFIGATCSFLSLRLSILCSILIVIAPLTFSIFWDKTLNKLNRQNIAKKLSNNKPDKFHSICLVCGGPAEYEYKVEKRETESEYREIIRMTCNGNCKEKGTQNIKDAYFQ